MTLPGYEIKATIARSEHTLLSRAVRLRDGKQVVLKQLAQTYPPLAALRRLEFEYRILSKLRVPGVIVALDLVDAGGRPVLVLEDFGAENLALAPGKRLALDQFLDAALQITRALGEIHARGVIHKDIKPHNLVMNRESGLLKLIDFQLATELSRENQGLNESIRLEGSLPYMSPEQTGRMNRSLDYRTDYYSLGVTFFQLLTGRLPFEAADVIGWVHAHISKTPLDAATIGDTPRMLSLIVQKLMAKDPDARYQSARGLLGDLERCQQLFRATGRIPAFELAEQDFSERFQISERLVGRQTEVRALLETFEQASQGSARLLLVSGYSGVGKSSLIREVHKPITEKNGTFVSGKFDQLDRNVPYGALVQAVRGLVRQLLAAPEDELRAVSGSILGALGANAQVMIDLIPELGHVIGPQPAAAQLNPSEAQHRFKRLFGEFIRVFARSEHPLVIFLDDLQWTDASTPDLLVDVLSEQNVDHLLIIGAYRDNEIQEGHLLPLAVDKIKARRPDVVHDVTLEPLSLADVNELCADSLHRPLEESQALGDLIFQKTAGNPFFATELLAELHRSGAIALANERGVWDFDLAAARRAAASDNVVDLMVSRLAALPAEARTALCAAACINNQFDLGTVAQLLGHSPAATARALWEPIARGLIVPRGDAYRLAQSSGPGLADQGVDELGVSYQFQHDRVQQAAYSLIEPKQRASMHLTIGRKLLSERDRARAGEHVFDVANHLNLGRSLLEDPAEREQLVRLNRRAAGKAKQSTAYAIAGAYLDTAIELLPAEAWAARPEERFEIHAERAECVLMAGDTSRAAALCQELSGLAPSRLARGAAYLLETRILEAQARFVDAVGAARAGLALFGINLPVDPEAVGQGIGAGIGRMQGHLGKTAPERLLELPDMIDPEKIMAMNLLFQSIPSAIQTCPPLFILAELTMFDLAVEHGLSPVSAKNFVDCGIIQGGILGDYATAYRLGKVAFQVLERYDAKAVASSVNFVFATYVSSWRASHEESLEAFAECYRVGMETGDIQHMGFGTALRMHRLLHLGHELDGCRLELASAIAFLERWRLPSQRTAVILAERALARLCDAGTSPEQLTRDDAEATARVQGSQNPQWIYAYAESQLVVSVLLSDFEAAERWQQMAEPHVLAATALISIPEYHLCEALILTRHKWPQAGESERTRIIDGVRQARDKLENWSNNCASNFAHKFHLVAAELARIEGSPLEVVLGHYQKAAQSTSHAYIHMRALALELQAQLWRDQDNPLFSQALLGEALDLYGRWGAQTKVRLLEQQCFAQLDRHRGFEVSRSSASQRASTFHSLTHHGLSRDALDLTSVIKATQTLSGEVRSDQLFQSLMSTLLENAAAQRGSLILCDDDTGQLSIEAQASVSSPARVHSRPLMGAEHVCVEVVQYTLRSREPVVLDDAGAHPQFSRDGYVRAHAIKSVLCLPIMHQGKLVAAFYAENNMITHAFSPDRVATLRLIAGQAAISIVNARLYANLESKVEDRTRELASKNREIIAMLDGMDQGVFSIDSKLCIQPQFSQQLPAILGTDRIAGQRFAPLLFAGSNVGDDARAATEMALQFSFGVTPALASLNADHLVREFSRRDADDGERHFELAWNPIVGSDGTVEKFLVVARDVTVLRRLREAQTQNALDAATVAQILSAGVEEFRGFCESARVFLRAGRGLATAGRELGREDAQRLFRDVHTIKGNARSLGLSRLVDEVHATEALLDERAMDREAPLNWADVFRKLESIEALLDAHEEVGQRKLGQLWARESDRLKQAIQEIEAALDGARAHPSQPAPALRDIERTVRRVQSVPLATLLSDVTRGLPSLAAELGKPIPSVEWQDAGVSLAPGWARVMKDVFTHLLRNALDHGIELPREREARGKPREGRIRMRAERADGQLRIRLADDGRGLALTRLRERGSFGAAQDEVIADSIFSPGVTTADRVSPLSGRGVGMDVVRTFVQEGGGRVMLSFTGEEQSGYRPFELLIDLPPEAILESMGCEAAPKLPGPHRVALTSV